MPAKGADVKAPSLGNRACARSGCACSGFVDTTLLWINLGISLLVLVLPAYFDLSLKNALAATLVGGLIGNSMLALAALIGADGRVPTMVLQRAPLGQRGSYIATVLNIAQCLGWAIFELIVIATAAGLLCDQLFGFQATWAWKLLFGGLAAALALLGPDRLRPPLRAQVRDLGGRASRSSTSRGGSSTERISGTSGRTRARTTARSGSRSTR